MANFAVIKDGKVDNIIIADNKAIAEEVVGLECVEYDPELIGNHPHIGLSYANEVFEQPEVVENTESNVVTP